MAEGVEGLCAPGGGARDLVIASGRAFCDWPTLFEAAGASAGAGAAAGAAAGAGWRLLVICGGHDRALVDRLNADGRAEVLSDVTPERARELLRGAAVSVLPMYDAGVSQGHVRLCDAIDAGAVVVASRTRSLEGYVEDGDTAVLVAPGDAVALREAVDRLLGDRPERERLARAAFERAAAWTWKDYLGAIEAFGCGTAGPEPPRARPESGSKA